MTYIPLCAIVAGKFGLFRSIRLIHSDIWNEASSSFTGYFFQEHKLLHDLTDDLLLSS